MGVSGTGDLPYTSGGYNPTLGIPGLNPLPQPGGPFALSLIATPHVQPTHVVSYSLDSVPSDDASPTGINLTFSGPINLSNLFVPDVQETAVEVVDSSGQVWPITSDSYNVSSATLQMIFDRPLPAGAYTLVSSPAGGLVDLAGQPVLGAGGSRTVLAHFSVSPSTAPLAGNNLGVLWPVSANELGSTSTGSFEERVQLAPGAQTAYHFTVIVPGYYKLATNVPEGSVAVSITGNGVTTILDSGSKNQFNNYLMQLGNGVYTLRFVNVSPESVALKWLLQVEFLDWEKIENNGVGQSFALSLSLFSPALTDASGGAGGGSSGGSTGAASAGGLAAVIASGSGSLFGGSMGPISSSLFVTSNTGLVGQPSIASQSLGVVGPTVPAGSTAIASNGNSLEGGILYGPTLDWNAWLEDEPQLADARKRLSLHRWIGGATGRGIHRHAGRSRGAG